MLYCLATCVAYASQALRNKQPTCKILVKAWFTVSESLPQHIDPMKSEFTVEEKNPKPLRVQLLKSKEVLAPPF